ncbi:DUF4227 family protein [Gracilibacillus alcaliphilus]|uniref:DUF4227 family protein n=1 Tax=Gracilibacillus alcaliphilus TaxID=1401441 RepID=UPI0019573FEA|nr:DUF4227 family protein [Gracilibacillus alcaliphilus]MBM7675110.1 hypothetical protein [Gracilibacillus alcaliphilus]
MPSFVKLCLDVMKIFVIFVVCTLLFYYVIKGLHSEYEKLDRYEYPQGNAIKVMGENKETDWWERLSIFFRLGE